MCQSKSEGGARCESHAKKAVAEHQTAYSNLVQQECMANGIIIDPAYYELNDKEHDIISSQFNADPAVKKARDEISKSKQNMNKLQGTLKEALGSGDVNRLATLIRQNNPEFKAINDDNEARRTTFNTNMAKATTEAAKDEFVLQNRIDTDLLNKRKEKLNFTSKKAAIGATNIYRSTGDSQRAILSLECLQEANRESHVLRDKLITTTVSVRKRMEENAIANKVRNDLGFQDAESSPAFRNSPVFQKWEAKEKELTENYRMTSGYQNQVAAKISEYKKAGMDTTEMEAAYKDLTVRKAKSEYKNIAEFHGTNSPQAKAAIENYNEVKQKEFSF